MYEYDAMYTVGVRVCLNSLSFFSSRLTISTLPKLEAVMYSVSVSGLQCDDVVSGFCETELPITLDLLRRVRFIIDGDVSIDIVCHVRIDMSFEKIARIREIDQCPPKNA